MPSSRNVIVMSTIDPHEFRRVLGHFPTGVTVVTGMDGTEPAGLTIGSFTSVSLDPPLVGFLPGRNSTTWSAIESSGHFCVNVLGSQQGDTCWTFAKSSGDASRFDGLSWHTEATGAPVIDGSLAWIDCSIEQVIEMGDHWFVLGAVVALGAEDGDPLLFFRGGLGTFGALS